MEKVKQTNNIFWDMIASLLFLIPGIVGVIILIIAVRHTSNVFLMIILCVISLPLLVLGADEIHYLFTKNKKY